MSFTSTYDYAGAIYRPAIKNDFDTTAAADELVAEVFYSRKVKRADEVVVATTQKTELARFELRMPWIPQRISSDHYLLDDMGDRFEFVFVDDENRRELVIEAIRQPYTGTIDVISFPYVARSIPVTGFVVSAETGTTTLVVDEDGTTVVSSEI